MSASFHRKCIDCEKPLAQCGHPSTRCWSCYNIHRRANAVTLKHVCIDCGDSLTLSAKETVRCRRCYDENFLRRKRPETTIFHASHGPIHVPEGHSVYWVRRGEIG